MSVMMYWATLATAKGRTATITRSPTPQDTTIGPDSQRIRRTGGIFRSARSRSRHGLSAFTRSFKSLLNETAMRKGDHRERALMCSRLMDARMRSGVGFAAPCARRRRRMAAPAMIPAYFASSFALPLRPAARCSRASSWAFSHSPRILLRIWPVGSRSSSFRVRSDREMRRTRFFSW